MQRSISSVHDTGSRTRGRVGDPILGPGLGGRDHISRSQSEATYLDEERHGKVGQAMRPGQLEHNVRLEKLVAGVESSSEALAQSALNEIPDGDVQRARLGGEREGSNRRLALPTTKQEQQHSFPHLHSLPHLSSSSASSDSPLCAAVSIASLNSLSILARSTALRHLTKTDRQECVAGGLRNWTQTVTHDRDG